MFRRYFDSLGIRGWTAVPLFNDQFRRPVEQGGLPDWDLEFLPHGGEIIPCEVKAMILVLLGYLFRTDK